ncbi:hypothetical protein X777_12663 [Ooceraea biroi]|uniref:Uncharacterized protein n=1 Tax=Ooceraea biroi TaxID=2015173 RepID=A0A026VZF6_OOCBI|nr:hypothetical protein X777_12663 [Ooceraea biroi]
MIQKLFILLKQTVYVEELQELQGQQLILNRYKTMSMDMAQKITNNLPQFLIKKKP